MGKKIETHIVSDEGREMLANLQDDDPRTNAELFQDLMKQIRPRPAYDVYNDIRDHLISVGLLPDDLFIIDYDFQHKNKDFPNGVISVTTHYGNNKDIYLNIDVLDEKQNKTPFAYGITQSDSNLAIVRMVMAAAEIQKVLHGCGETEPVFLTLLNQAEKDYLSERISDRWCYGVADDEEEKMVEALFDKLSDHEGAFEAREDEDEMEV